MASRNNTRNKPRCTITGCGKIGHTEERCWVAHPELKPQAFRHGNKPKQRSSANRVNSDNTESNQRIGHLPTSPVPIAEVDCNTSQARREETTRNLPLSKRAMSEPQPLWTRYSCLPAELRDQIHGYNLVSSRPVCIEATEDGHLKYQWREYPEVANKMLSQAMKFYVWSDEGAHSNEALAYLLSHNTLIVQNKTSAKALVSTNQSLSKAGYSAYPLRIKVQVPPDPYVNWLETGDDDDIERNHQIALDDNDFETGDRRRLGLRAFRILSPLTKLSRLHEIQVILQWNVEMDEDSLVVVGRENPAIRMFGAVIAKLKNLVAASSNGLEFKVIEIYQHDFEDKELDDYYYGESSENEDDAAVEKDLTWVWNAPSEEECRRMKKHAESRKKADAMRVRIWEMNRAISNCHGHFKSRYRKDHGAKLGEEKERLETQVEKLMSQIQGLPPTEQCSVERCYVSGLAADPNWEKAVEIIAKQRPPSSDRWRPSTVRELEEDSFWWMRM